MNLHCRPPSANIYSVNNSAFSDDVGLRERKRRQTQSALIADARRLTLVHGLGGFTIEQLCDDVGVSRRTFFNYFPSKEDAVLGLSGDGPPEELLTRFVESGGAEHPVPLLEALIDLSVAVADRMGITREDYEAMHAVLQKEPQLIGRMFAAAEPTSQLLTELIARREQLPVDHPTPRVTTFVIGGLSRRSFDEFFAEGNTLTYPQLLRRNMEALRHLFPASTLPTSQNQDPA